MLISAVGLACFFCPTFPRLNMGIIIGLHTAVPSSNGEMSGNDKTVARPLLSLWSKRMFYYIKAIEPHPENYTIKITHSDDVVVNAEFKDLLEKGIMRTLKNPDVFKQVSIDNKGRSILWEAQDIDFCADALLLKFH